MYPFAFYLFIEPAQRPIHAYVATLRDIAVYHACRFPFLASNLTPFPMQ